MLGVLPLLGGEVAQPWSLEIQRSTVAPRCLADVLRYSKSFVHSWQIVSDIDRYCELTLAYTGNLVWFYDQLWQKSSTGTSADTSEDEEEAATSWVFEAF